MHAKKFFFTFLFIWISVSLLALWTGYLFFNFYYSSLFVIGLFKSTVKNS